MVNKAVNMSLPADKEYVLLARMALSGLGMVVGLEVDLIDDLCTAANEICDCLMHQPVGVSRLELEAHVEEGRLCCSFRSQCACGCSSAEPQDLEITRGVLETILPDVTLCSEDHCVRQIIFSLPVESAEGV